MLKDSNGIAYNTVKIEIKPYDAYDWFKIFYTDSPQEKRNKLQKKLDKVKKIP